MSYIDSAGLIPQLDSLSLSFLGPLSELLGQKKKQPYIMIVKKELIATLNKNINECRNKRDNSFTLDDARDNYSNPLLNDIGLGTIGSVDLYLWFAAQVNAGQRWDYKKAYPKGSLERHLYEDFGNFNYGATGAALGMKLEDLLRAAGAAQPPGWSGHPGTWKLHALFEFDIIPGQSPYGDDDHDQYWIRQGYDYFCRRYGGQ